MIFFSVYISILVYLLSIFSLYLDLTNKYLFIIFSITTLLAYIINKKLDNRYFTKPEIIWITLAVAIPFLALFLVSAMPVFTGDEIAYSVALPKLYADAKRIFYVSDYGPYSAFPQNYEALTTLSFIVFDSPILSKIINLIMVLSISCIGWDISRRQGCNKIISTLTPLFFLTSSVVITYSPIAKNDIANGFFQILSLYFIYQYNYNKKLINIILCAFFAGLSLGTKLNSLFFISILTIFVLYYLTFLGNKYEKKSKNLAIYFFVLIISASPWYINNLLLFGNPLYPAFNEYFLLHNSFNINYVRMFRELFFHDIADFSWSAGTIKGFCIKFSKEFGYIVFSAGLIGGILASFTSNKISVKLFANFTLLLTLITLLFSFWEPRYNLSLLFLMCINSTFLVNKVIGNYKYRKNMSKFILTTVIIIGVINFYNIYYKMSYEYIVMKRDEFMIKYIPWWEATEYINNNIDKNKKIAIASVQPFYYLSGFSYYHIHPLMEKGDLLSIKNGKEFEALLCKQQVNYIVFDDWPIIRPDNINTPIINKFCRNIFKLAIPELIKNNQLSLIKKINNIQIYKFKCQNKNE
ncbi:glycosyltransferase family 39 protein [Polynucleobacter sp. es-MAR-4]|uniref:ArnT family glycosyltransferase n=1 Tax=Polynucleobacter sp. es-MAR-4 TaxID=1855655 RepID=UPI001C0E7943|nr:phospholipid carrier-dependent glycosyltransferase [Polynucleobacter sp. es-MAR-4]MBU3637576.1 hypothetical protein [Polynucleobacter sp. es-MAR-4]